MTLGQTIFILAIMPFTIIGLVVVSKRMSKLFDKKHKDIENEE